MSIETVQHNRTARQRDRDNLTDRQFDRQRQQVKSTHNGSKSIVHTGLIIRCGCKDLVRILGCFRKRNLVGHIVRTSAHCRICHISQETRRFDQTGKMDRAIVNTSIERRPKSTSTGTSTQAEKRDASRHQQNVNTTRETRPESTSTGTSTQAEKREARRHQQKRQHRQRKSGHVGINRNLETYVSRGTSRRASSSSNSTGVRSCNSSTTVIPSGGVLLVGATNVSN